MYKDLKVTQGEVASNNVKSAPDRLRGTATENKNIFDKLVELFVAKYNTLLDQLDDNAYIAIDPITIEGYTISHADSGITQGKYGSDEDQYPQDGGTFIVPYFITDSHGHLVSAGEREVTLPPGGGGGGATNWENGTGTESVKMVSATGATGDYSVAEGDSTVATGYASHAEGASTTASKPYSHTQNEGTRANAYSQTAIGTFNSIDAEPSTAVHPNGAKAYGNYAFIIGNGTGTTTALRSNALTVDWQGNLEASGNITDGSGNALDDKLDVSGVLNIFYPVGSYYETSDTAFNPNTAWGGTWVLETAGQFHVSAGTGYAAGSTGGSANAIVPYHRHGKGELEGSTPTLSANKDTFVTSASEVGSARGNITSSSSSSYYYARSAASGVNWGRATPTIASGKTVTISGNTAYAGTSGNTTGANMPPYIAVNRWHRTA